MRITTPFGRRSRPGFSLVELMIVVLIVAILATLVIGAYTGSMQLGKVARTRAQMAKIDSLLAPIWESYRTRRPGLEDLKRVAGGIDPRTMDAKQLAKTRLAYLRELQRFELPDRLTDFDVAENRSRADLPPRMQLYLTFAKQVAPEWMNPTLPFGDAMSRKHQGAECLYVILANTQEDDTNGLEFFRPAEIQDTDGDGMKEILDGWGRPIEFLRWAPGFESDKQMVHRSLWSNRQDDQDETAKRLAEEWIEENPDPFDPLAVDTEEGGLNTDKPTYYLHPLVFSAGPDGKYHIASDVVDREDDMSLSQGVNYSDHDNNPYQTFKLGELNIRLGQPIPDLDRDPYPDLPGWGDNIHNHFVRVRMQ